MDEDGNLPIHISCSTCGIRTIEVWHERGFDFNVKSRSGKDCVFAACKFGHAQVLRLLQSYGVSLKKEKPNGHSVLGYAFCRGNIDAFEYLLDYYLQAGHLQSDPGLTREMLGLFITAGSPG